VTAALVSLDVQAPVAWLRLERPRALNALNRPLAAELEATLVRVARLDDVAVLIVAGRGRAFCAGNDIAEMANVDATEAEAHAERLAGVLDTFARLPQVTLAAIDGHALGGGLMLALAQDLRIASDRARFGFPEVSLGFNPGYGIARVLDVLGGSTARDLLLTGRTIHASEALRLGVVNRVVAATTLESSATVWATEIARAPREALAATKAIVTALRDGGRGDEPARFGALLRPGAPARGRVQAFLARKGGRAAN
jgi:enoyl-CoA hydratase/carnithine racemase